ncbi:hypothetical protein AWZ03_010676 [Drosophila navojoa]|uniref:Uncharacterized protein n=1 Tax=Drosophila navojoa TaxID=7232 RepID=A0A484B2G6_DRONA|nr:hypothetical protein AWZ03_010676 [Drosophila navojoa]
MLGLVALRHVRPRPSANGRLAGIALHIINIVAIVLIMMTATPTRAEIPSKAGLSGKQTQWGEIDVKERLWKYYECF